MDASDIQKNRTLFEQTVSYLHHKERILFLTTSNRWAGEKGGELAKSTRLALRMADLMGSKITVIDITQLKIYPCEGNVSTERGNTCGVRDASLTDSTKNPSGHHRCWASINNPDDELWKISKTLFTSDVVVFFGSVRWGQVNARYQQLIERLTWIENRHSSLGESNIVAGVDAGIILVGQNWHGAEALATQRQVLGFFGFNVVPALCWHWQYTTDAHDETPESYVEAAKDFEETFLN